MFSIVAMWFLKNSYCGAVIFFPAKEIRSKEFMKFRFQCVLWDKIMLQFLDKLIVSSYWVFVPVWCPLLSYLCFLLWLCGF
ncbi:MAG: hypothetical protein CL554_05935 [Algoriphagus sp.]|nr:hypothetical protein [Algoriphagus sp.]MAN86314.1 hypothetical protein [Algoriphagus sp.]HAS60964.1 hypothetical protein [Algoriphagus sp.]HCB47067.1 hypothetical protein [Algoriphagus sp.]HCH45834.1 hypothetical protein [Algoriphagus sp.]